MFAQTHFWKLLVQKAFKRNFQFFHTLELLNPVEMLGNTLNTNVITRFLSHAATSPIFLTNKHDYQLSVRH